MTDPHNDDHDDHDDTSDERNPDRGGVRLTIGAGLSTLANILDALDSGERVDRSGQSSDRSVSYRYSIDTGLDSDDASPATRPSPRRRKRRTRGSGRSDDHVTNVRRTDEGVVLVADFQGLDEDELTVGLDRDRGNVVVAVEESVVERVPLDVDDFEITDATYNNGVLEVRFEEGRSTAGGRDDDGEEEQ